MALHRRQLLLGVIGALASAELALRVMRFGLTPAALGAWSATPPWNELRSFAPDGAPEPTPGAAAAWALGPGQPVVRYRLNRLGLREDRDVSAWPAPGTCRMLALGDAYTFGYGVAAGDAWPQRLERRLTPHQRVEVLNAGFPNLNAEQQRRRLETLLARLHPDVVIVTFDWWNVPLEDIHRPRAPRWSRAWWAANAEEKAARLGAHVALVGAALGVARDALAGSVLPPSGLARELEPLTVSPDAIATRWARTRTALAGMAEAAATAGARFLLVATPLDLQVDAGRNVLYRAGRLPYPAHGFADIDYRTARAMPEALARFAAGAGIELLDLAPDFAAHGAGRLFLREDYHLAAGGHARIARAIARWMAANRPCQPASESVAIG